MALPIGTSPTPLEHKPLISLAVVAAFAALSLLLAVGMVRALVNNLRQGNAARAALAGRMQAAPLHQALSTFGHDARAYLYGEPVTLIENHLRACEACTDHLRCRALLEQGADCSAFGFCPNRDALCGAQRAAA